MFWFLLPAIQSSQRPGHYRKKKQTSYITSQRKISLIKGNEDNNDNIIKNATSTALYVLCLKHNFFFHWSWHQLHNYKAKITDVTFNGGLEQLGWDYLFLFELLPTLYFTNWVRLNKPNKFLKSDNSFSERHFNHCHYYGCSLLFSYSTMVLHTWVGKAFSLEKYFS